MRARPTFFVFCVHLFTISTQHAYDQRIVGEGFTCKAFTESSPISSPQHSLYEFVRSNVKGEHTKSELGDVRVRDRDVRAGACPREKKRRRVKVQIERADERTRSAERVVRLPRRRANSVRALEQVRNEDEKVPSFFDKAPYFVEKVDVFSP